jgi:hypothetical protein
MPGQPVYARAFPIFPRRFTLENRRSAASFAANRRSASLDKSYVFGKLTLVQVVARCNTKTLLDCEQAVEDVPSLWKAEENCRGIAARQMWDLINQNSDTVKKYSSLHSSSSTGKFVGAAWMLSMGLRCHRKQVETAPPDTSRNSPSDRQCGV